MLTNLSLFVINFTVWLLFGNSCTHQRCHLSTYLQCFRTESRDHISPNSQTYFVRPLGKFLTRTPKRELVKWCQNWSPKSQKQYSIIECYDMWLSLSRSLLFQQLWTRLGGVVWERKVKWIGHGCKSHFYMIDGEPDAAFLLFFSALGRVPFNLSCMLAAEMWRSWYAPYRIQNQNKLLKKLFLMDHGQCMFESQCKLTMQNCSRGLHYIPNIYFATPQEA